MADRKPTPEETKRLLEHALIEAIRDKALTKALAHYVHSQCAAGVDAMTMCISLHDLAAVMMASAIYETPPIGSVCKVIEGMENYFHAKVHDEINILVEANKK